MQDHMQRCWMPQGLPLPSGRRRRALPCAEAGPGRAWRPRAPSGPERGLGAAPRGGHLRALRARRCRGRQRLGRPRLCEGPFGGLWLCKTTLGVPLGGIRVSERKCLNPLASSR